MTIEKRILTICLLAFAVVAGVGMALKGKRR